MLANPNISNVDENIVNEDSEASIEINIETENIIEEEIETDVEANIENENTVKDDAKTNVENVLNPEVIDYYGEFKKLGFYKEDYKNSQINNRNALLRFQSEHNLAVDGSIGKEVKGAMLKRLADDEYKYTDIVANPASNKYWIAINKTKRILTLYEGKEVVKKYPIAQGKTPSHTPEGKFTIVTKAVNPTWSYNGKSAKGGAEDNPLGKRWIGISHEGGWAYGIHGNNSPNSIGTDVSLGCIRMINSDVEELYDLISLNIPIWIGSNSQLEKWEVYQQSYALID